MRKSSAIPVRLIKQIVLLVVAALSALFGWQYQSTAKSAGEYGGRVVAVSDGDTIKVLDNQNQEIKIRFAYIDAPEKKQAFGMRAKQSLSDLVYGKEVEVVVTDTDRYGRKVAVIYLPTKEGRLDINLEQVKRGMAWHYVAYAKKSQNASAFDAYQEAESTAREKQEGLWQEDAPVAPWDFRRQQ